MPQICDEQNVRILNRDKISITDFSFAQTPVWLSTTWHCYGPCLYLKL